MKLVSANFVFQNRQGIVYGYITGGGLKQILLYQEGKPKPYVLHERPNILLGRLLTFRLDRYFSGINEDFSDIPLDLTGASEFQLRVWDALRKISFGKTCTYAELAVRAGFPPRYARAVGFALGRNPIPIIIPCHRVLPATGGLGSFSAGVEWKRRLLQIEGVTV
ncbi:MAG: methylated-DNA--[protein]-cysteine S-methyltransferase [Candidatus Hydrogenedentes bacterium]|nr:methylated-DNA--[protein]-cysteine S-methyltransferase [Candidatus Hydrogenedentota bacterium]